MSNEFIKWSTIYSVGVEKIDKQHKYLTEVINKLFNAFSEGKAETIIPEIITELSDYTHFHFKTEEEIFEQYQFPEKEAHILKHQEFIDNVGKWSEEIDQKKKDVHYDMMNYLKNWLLEHIQQDDKLYGKFLADNNIQIQ